MKKKKENISIFVLAFQNEDRMQTNNSETSCDGDSQIINEIPKIFHDKNVDVERFVLENIGDISNEDIGARIDKYSYFLDLVQERLQKKIEDHSNSIVEGFKTTHFITKGIQESLVLCREGRGYLKQAGDDLTCENEIIIQKHNENKCLSKISEMLCALNIWIGNIQRMKKFLSLGMLSKCIESYKASIYECEDRFENIELFDFLYSKYSDFKDQIIDDIEYRLCIITFSFNFEEFREIVGGLTLLGYVDKVTDIIDMSFVKTIKLRILSSILKIYSEIQEKSNIEPCLSMEEWPKYNGSYLNLYNDGDYVCNSPIDPIGNMCADLTNFGDDICDLEISDVSFRLKDSLFSIGFSSVLEDCYSIIKNHEIFALEAKKEYGLDIIKKEDIIGKAEESIISYLESIEWCSLSITVVKDLIKGFNAFSESVCVSEVLGKRVSKKLMDYLQSLHRETLNNYIFLLEEEEWWNSNVDVDHVIEGSSIYFIDFDEIVEQFRKFGYTETELDLISSCVLEFMDIGRVQGTLICLINWVVLYCQSISTFPSFFDRLMVFVKDLIEAHIFFTYKFFLGDLPSLKIHESDALFVDLNLFVNRYSGNHPVAKESKCKVMSHLNSPLDHFGVSRRIEGVFNSLCIVERLLFSIKSGILKSYESDCRLTDIISHFQVLIRQVQVLFLRSIPCRLVNFSWLRPMILKVKWTNCKKDAQLCVSKYVDEVIISLTIFRDRLLSIEDLPDPHPRINSLSSKLLWMHLLHNLFSIIEDTYKSIKKISELSISVVLMDFREIVMWVEKNSKLTGFRKANDIEAFIQSLYVLKLKSRSKKKTFLKKYGSLKALIGNINHSKPLENQDT